MANHKSARKRARQNERKRVQNKSYLSKVKTSIKGFYMAIEAANESKAGFEPVQSRFKEVQSCFQKAVTKGLFHRNTASRSIARLNRRMVLVQKKNTAE